MKRNALKALSAAVLIALLSATGMTASAQQPVGDAKNGATKIRMCQGCHGIEGWRTAYPEVYHIPRIGGQHATYFVNALKAYKSGERKHPGMRAIAASLSEADMADLAAYYAEAKQ